MIVGRRTFGSCSSAGEAGGVAGVEDACGAGSARPIGAGPPARPHAARDTRIDTAGCLREPFHRTICAIVHIWRRETTVFDAKPRGPRGPYLEGASARLGRVGGARSRRVPGPGARRFARVGRVGGKL